MSKTIGDRFEIGDFIAQGGMGAVYRGLDLRTQDPVAIKHIRAEIAYEDPKIIERFEREGKVLRQLNHPNVVKMLAAIEQDGDHYLVMEYVTGGSLADHLTKHGKLSTEQLLQIGLDVTDALVRAHRLDILHRDIKPANILLSENGVTRLSDFGIARLGDSIMTENGEILGTYPYLAPEILNGEIFDERADIWALGITLFEMLTGHLPFRAPNLLGTIKAIMQQPVPDLEALSPKTPIGLIDLIYRMLEKDQTGRVDSARQVGAELEKILKGQDSSRVSQHPAISSETTQMKSVIPNNLPARATSFVGREVDLSKLDRLLSDPNNRLITLVSVGGMGKTRLAIEAARSQLSKFTNGVFFVDLVPLTSGDFIVPKIAEAVRFSFSGTNDAKLQLLNFLSQKKMLIILDNFEHLLANSDIITEILDAAPKVKIMVTSRDRLNLQVEHLFWVGGMEFSNWENTQEALSCGVVNLFRQGAVRSKSSFTISERDLPPLKRICERVAGMPLGILLAASWVETLSLEEIAQELSASADFLETDLRDLPARQRSMRAVFEYSWNLLSAEERQVFKKVAIFPNGFARDAGQTITGVSLQTLMSLVSKSFIRRRPNGRFETHALLRQYGEEKLGDTPDMKGDLQALHCRYYAEFINKREADLRGYRHVEAMQELEEDFENILLAWEFATMYAQEREIRQMIVGLDRFLASKSLFRQKFEVLQKAADRLEQVDSVGDSLASGVVLGFLSMCYGDLGDNTKGLALNDRALAILEQYDAPRELATTLALRNWMIVDPVEKARLLKQSLAIFRQVGDQVWIASVLLNLSFTLSWLGQLTESERCFAEAESIGKATGDPLLTIMYAQLKGDRAVKQSDYVQAKVYYQDALAVSQRMKSPQKQAECLSYIARTAFLQGDYAQAEGGFQQALSINQELGLLQTQADNLRDLAVIAYVQGKYDVSQKLTRDSLKIAREVNVFLPIVMALNHLARTLTAQGNYSQAKKYLLESLNLWLETRATSFVFEALVVWADLLAHQGQPEKALSLLSFSVNNPDHVLWFSTFNYVQYFADQQMTALKASLAPEVFAAAEQQGTTLELVPILQEFSDAES